MKLPYFDESNLPGSIWSSAVSVLQAQKGLPHPTFIGERSVDDPSYWLRNHGKRTPWATLKICLDGRGEIDVHGERQIIEAGQALLFTTTDTGIAHGIAQDAAYFHFIRFTFIGMESIIEEMNKRFGYLLPVDKSHSIVKRLKKYEQDSHSSISMQPAEAAELCWSIVAACMHLFESSQLDNSLSRRCIAWINKHIEGTATIADCAAALAVSQEHLTRVFHECVKETPGAFLMRERLRHGLRLLLSSHEPIKAIGSRCGYKNVLKTAAARHLLRCLVFI